MRIVSLCPKSIQHLGMTPPVLNFWFEFASTYSYPAMMRITSLADAAGIALKFRPFLLGPVFKSAGLGNISIRSLRFQGPQHVARS
jgi:2-hydroxychromene-2-carboxylate isomerase